MNRRTPALYKLLALLFSLALVAGACGGSDDTTDDATPSEDDGAAKELKDAPGFSLANKEISLGVLTPLSGPVSAPIGIPLTDGGRVYWQRVNAEGGIAGKYEVKLLEEDNVYDPAQTKTKYTKIKDSVVMFSQILGTPPTKAVLGDLKTDGIAASPASLDSAWVREPNLLPIGSTYQLQFVNVADYLIKDKGFKGKPICIFALEGEYGDAGIQGLEHAAEELDFEIAVTARAKATDTDFTAQATQLKNGNCAVVFITALPTQTGGLVGKGAQLGFNPQWVGQSPSWASALAGSAAAPLLEKSYLLAGEGPVWGDTSVPGMKQMLEDVAKYKPDQKPDGYFQFGYIQAIAVHALLEKAVELGDLSREGILNAIAELEEVDYQGLYGDYKYGKASERDPSRETATFAVDLKAAAQGFLKKVDSRSSAAAKSFELE